MVKASGAGLAAATAADFVVVDVDEVMAVVDDPTTDQDDLSAVLVAAGTDRPRGAGPRRGSIEAVVHAAVHRVARDAGVVTRRVSSDTPTPLRSWGCSPASARRRRGPDIVYSDEAVVMGRPLFVPYATPGLALGRLYAVALRAYVEHNGALPQLVLLANHGIVAIAPTTAGVEAVSTMAVKGARVRATAYAVGGVAPLSDADVEKFFARDDIAERRANLARGR